MHASQLAQEARAAGRLHYPRASFAGRANARPAGLDHRSPAETSRQTGRGPEGLVSRDRRLNRGIRQAFGIVAIAAAFVACSGQTTLVPRRSPATAAPGQSASFSVGPPIAVNYVPWIKLRLPDEHVSFIKYADGFRVWSSAGNGYTFVYKSTDLTNFSPATANPVFGPPRPGLSSFDENYAGAGQVLRDPANPKKLYMLYEADSYCYGNAPRVCMGSFYYWASVGTAQADDPAETGNPRDWSGFKNDQNPAGRTAALVSPDGKPSAAPPRGYYGDGIPSGFVDPRDPTHAYLYAFYEYHPYPQTNANQSRIEAARGAFADLRNGAPSFKKFNNGFVARFDQAGQPVVPVDASGNCASQQRPSVSYNTVLRRYLMILVCNPPKNGIPQWYYTTTTSIAAQAWATPLPLTAFTSGHAWYPSFVSPDQPDGSTTDATGLIFFQWGPYLPYTATFSITP
jgi:hypothetical protein